MNPFENDTSWSRVSSQFMLTKRRKEKDKNILDPLAYGAGMLIHVQELAMDIDSAGALVARERERQTENKHMLEQRMDGSK